MVTGPGLSSELLLAALEHLPDPVTLLEAVHDGDGPAVDLRIVYLNDAAALRQVDAAAAPGALCTEVWPAMAANGSLAACLGAVNTGVPQAGSFAWTNQETSEPLGYDYRAVPLGGDTLLWALRNTGAQLHRAQVLAAVTTALAQATEEDDVAELLATTAVTAVGAAASAVAVAGPEPGTGRLLRAAALELDLGATFPLDAPYPLARVLRTGEPIFCSDRAARAADFPDAERTLGHFAASAIMPLHVEDRVFGAVSMHFAEEHAFDDDERGYLGAVAAQCAQALERARAQADARRRRAQMFALSEVGDALASSLDLDATLDNVAATVVGALADACLIQLADDGGGVRLAAAAQRDGALRPVVERLAAEHPAPVDGGAWSAVDGDAVIADQVQLDGAGAYARLIAPLRHDGTVRGALVLVNDVRRGFAPGDVPFASELARRSEMAVANARAYSRQRDIAHELQLSLLSAPQVSVPGLEVAARYRPAEAEADVGGDWYDMLELRDGRVAVVIGDVMGHGLAAASAMGQLRTLVRGLAYEGVGVPDVLLRRLDAINEGLRITDFATLVLGFVDPPHDGGAASLRLASAGHLPPLVLRPGADPWFVDEPPAPPLGVGAGVPRESGGLLLAAGATLLLYTDGLIETRDASLAERLADLRSAARGLAGLPVDEVLDRLLAAFAGEDDDVALLAVRVTGEVR